MREICVPCPKAVIGVMGIMIALSAGCATKSLQSDGTEGKPATGQSRSQAGGTSKGSATDGVAGAAGADASASAGTDASRSMNGDEQRVVRDPMPDPAVSDRERQAAEELRRAEEAATKEAGMQDVFFDYNEFTISEAGQQALVHDAAWMKSHPEKKIRIEGQCDERGSQAYNQVLGEKRAKVVQRYLKDLGVVNDLTVISLGKDRPWCAEHTEACYQQNRRGHVVVRVN